MENLRITEEKNGVKFSAKIIPNSSKCEICGIIDGVLKIKLDVPPIEGQANEKLIKFLAKKLNIPKTFISIIKGESSKNKTLFITNITPDLLYQIKY